MNKWNFTVFIRNGINPTQWWCQQVNQDFVIKNCEGVSSDLVNVYQDDLLCMVFKR